jgi:hypothetical protein
MPSYEVVLAPMGSVVSVTFVGWLPLRDALAAIAPDFRAHLPTPNPDADEEDDEDDDDRGSGGGNIDPDDDEDSVDEDDEDDEEPLWTTR